jgi:hypothetical protein
MTRKVIGTRPVILGSSRFAQILRGQDDVTKNLPLPVSADGDRWTTRASGAAG